MSNNSRTLRNQRRRRPQNRATIHSFDQLETRRLLAFTGAFVGNELIISQTADDGAITILKSGTDGTWAAFDGAGTSNFGPASNASIFLQDHENNDLTVELESQVEGDLELNLGDVERNVFLGGVGGIDGALDIFADTNGGETAQSLWFQPTNRLELNGPALISLGGGSDFAFIESADFTGALTPDLDFRSVNNVVINQTNVAGGLRILAVETFSNSVALQDSDVGGAIDYEGSFEYDVFSMIRSSAGGVIDIDLGDEGPVVGFGNLVDVVDSTAERFETRSRGGGGGDVVQFTGGQIDFLKVDPGDGTNNVSIDDIQVSGRFRYLGGDGIDTLTYAAQSASTTEIEIAMGLGVDQLDMQGTEFSAVEVDMEDGLFSSTFSFETFTHQLNDQFNDFPVSIVNWNGFTHEFENGQLTTTQNIVTPDLRLRGDGGSSTRLQVAGTQTMDIVPTNNFLLRMLDDSNTNIEWAMGGLFPGNVAIDMGDGDRELTQDGEFLANVAGQFNVTGGEGEQSLPGLLGTFGQMGINLGEGSDFVSIGFVNVAGRINFANVEALSTVGVAAADTTRISAGGNLSIDNRSVVFSSLSVAIGTSLNNILVGGNLTYLGGDDYSDRLSVTVGDIGGNVFFDPGNDVDGIESRLVLLGVTVGGNLSFPNEQSTVDSVTGIRLNSVILDQVNFPMSVAGNTNLRPGRGLISTTLRSEFGDVVSYRAHDESSSDFALLSASPETRMNIIFGTKNDNFQLSASANDFEDLRVDFRGGDDGFVNGNSFASLGFRTRFLNLNGFSVFGLPDLQNTHVMEIASTGFDFNIAADGPCSAGFGPSLWRIQGVDFNGSDNVSVRMLDNSGTDLNFEIACEVGGSIRPNLGNGDRTFTISVTGDGLLMPVEGSLRINGGEGNQQIKIGNAADPVGMALGLRMSVATGNGVDRVEFEDDVEIGGSLILNGVNQYVVNEQLDVGFNMSVNTMGDDTGMNGGGPGIVGSSINIGNDFNFFGGQTDSRLRLDNYSIANHAFLNLGGSIGAPGNFNFFRLGSSDIGSLTVLSSSVQSRLTLAAESTVRDRVFVNFEGSASSIGNLLGTVESGDVIYRGTDGVDEVTVSLDASQSNVRIDMYDGEDEVRLRTNSNLGDLLLEFGDDIDSFVDDFNGAYPFNVVVGDLP